MPREAMRLSVGQPKRPFRPLNSPLGFRQLLLLAAFVAVVLPGPETFADDTMFPFLVSYDAPDNVTNVSSWLEKPAGKHGFVRSEHGQFVTDAGPIRFSATNLCFDACFPSHSQAECVAARLARFGINCVRMHHMDNRSIWGKSPDKLTIDPARLERLDYLIFQLKRHGIYTDINLHVSRSLGKTEGFPVQGGRPNYDKGVDNFEPQMIELQKKYAADLLTHVNPYTGQAYCHEPAVAMVEINNENALFNQWSRNQLDDLADPYAKTFRLQWNAWLRKRYGSTDRLREAWNAQYVPLGKNLVVNGDFTQPLSRNWHLEKDSETKVTWDTVAEGPSDNRCLRIVVTRNGSVAWHPQLSQSGFKLTKNSPYTLTCFLRADEKHRIGLNCMMAHEPWERLGFSGSAEVDSTWKRHQFTFVADRDDANARITVTGMTPGTYEIAEVSFQSGGIRGLAPAATLEENSVPVMKRRQANRTETARRDFVDFLWDTEEAYWLGMYRFLKNDLQVQPVISGTQLSYSPIGIQSQLDYIDAHAYWQHPRFPGRSWDSRNWYIQNRALVNDPKGTLTDLAARRIHGLPFTISEYNHPTPLQYESEGFLMLSAIAAFQDWNGIFSFAYCHNSDFKPESVRSYFDIKANAVKLVHMPACAAIYLRGDVGTAKESVVTRMTINDERQSLYLSGDPWRFTRDRFGTDPRTAILHQVELDINKASGREENAADIPASMKEFVSDTGQIKWNVQLPDAGYFIVDTPASKVFTGFVRGRTFSLGELQVTIGKTRKDWATLSFVCLEGQKVTEPGRVLIAVTGQMQNTNAQFDDLGQDRITLQRGWGEAPLLCEGVPAEIKIPVNAKKVQLFALDSAGDRKEAAAVEQVNGKAVLRLSPKHRTLWYELVVR